MFLADFDFKIVEEKWNLAKRLSFFTQMEVAKLFCSPKLKVRVVAMNIVELATSITGLDFWQFSTVKTTPPHGIVN